MLKLSSGYIRHPIASGFLGLADTQAAQHPRQRRILDLDTLFFHQFLVHPLNPPLTLLVKPLEQIGINADLVTPGRYRHLPLLLDDCPNRVPAHSQAAGNLLFAHAFLV